MNRFETVKINRTTSFVTEGMEVTAFIAGVNSGVYGLPFVISVKTWAKTWCFKKFFHREMQLNLWEVEQLRDECNKVIQFYKEKGQKEEQK